MQIEYKFIPSSKGNIATAIHHLSTETDKLAILCPGYLDTKDYAHLVKLCDELAACGYTAVRFDPTGTWESGGDISDYNATQSLSDVRTILEHMILERDYKHILLGGHSLGGHIAMQYASQDPRISVVLALMSPYSLRRPLYKDGIEKWENRGYRTSKRQIPGRNEKREFSVPYSNAEDRLKYNVTDSIRHFRGLLILIGGELDDRIFMEDLRLIYDNANEPKKLIIIKGIAHNYRHNDRDIDIVNQNILAQLPSCH
jgi:pimeloyl-ACP methyl ester carboxylesterase